jgi:hypothetical protein
VKGLSSNLSRCTNNKGDIKMPLHDINNTINFIQGLKTIEEKILYIMENNSKNDNFEGIEDTKKRIGLFESTIYYLENELDHLKFD